MGVDLMKFDETQEEIKRYSMAAGAGNFDRTIFEKSSAVSITDFNNQDFYSIAKFIAPKEGMYKIDFDYTLTSKSSGSFYACIELSKFQMLYTKSTGGAVTSQEDDSYYAISLGKDTRRIGIYDLHRELIVIDRNKPNTGHITCYIYLPNGNPVLLQAYAYANSKNEAVTFTMKNLKITY